MDLLLYLVEQHVYAHISAWMQSYIHQRNNLRHISSVQSPNPIQNDQNQPLEDVDNSAFRDSPLNTWDCFVLYVFYVDLLVECQYMDAKWKKKKFFKYKIKSNWRFFFYLFIRRKSASTESCDLLSMSQRSSIFTVSLTQARLITETLLHCCNLRATTELLMRAIKSTWSACQF